MENKEFTFKGFVMNGFLSLLLLVAMYGWIVYAAINGIALWSIPVVVIVSLVWLGGYMMLEPNEARAMLFFGKYCGTFYKNGFYWVNPFLTAKKVSLRARNLNAEPIKVNDKAGNPIMIGLVLVWRVKSSAGVISASVARMNAFETFVSVQSDAALRQVAGDFNYDNNDSSDAEAITLRSGADEINELLVVKLNERLSIAGIEVTEARINYLAYAPEIAAVMLRRQQADAIISAREKIVEGAVSMVSMALDKLSAEQIVELDEEKKAAMVSNLLVVLCADESAQPVVNTGTLNH